MNASVAIDDPLLRRTVMNSAGYRSHESNERSDYGGCVQWKTALVISDPPHLRRLDMVWGPACAQHGLEYRLIAT
jgi:hypothetical protein